MALQYWQKLLTFIQKLQRVKQLRRWLRRWYFGHFSLLVFILIAILLCTGLVYLEKVSWISYIIALILFVLVSLYYSLHFLKFQKLIDFYTRQKYYFDIFSFWGVVFFNILSICSLGFVGTVINIIFSDVLFGNAPYNEVTLGIFQAAVDGGTFGLLDAFGIDLCEFLTETCTPQLGRFSNLYTYAVSLTIDLAFWASITGELVGWIEAKREVAKLLDLDTLASKALTPEEIKRNQVILRLISEGKIDVTDHENKLVTILKDSTLKEVRNVFLFIMQSTRNMLVFKLCLDYFKTTKDIRFKKVCSRIRHHEKRKLIEDFEFRQVKTKPWRKRGRKPKT